MTKTNLKKDDGYTIICPVCDARYGEKKFGERSLKIAWCDKCQMKTMKSDRQRSLRSAK